MRDKTQVCGVGMIGEILVEKKVRGREKEILLGNWNLLSPDLEPISFKFQLPQDFFLTCSVNPSKSWFGQYLIHSTF